MGPKLISVFHEHFLALLPQISPGFSSPSLFLLSVDHISCFPDCCVHSPRSSWFTSGIEAFFFFLFCLYVWRTSHTQWRYQERLLLLARWGEGVLGNLLPEVIVFCSSGTFLQIMGIVKLLTTEHRHLHRPRSGFMLLCRIWWTGGCVWLRWAAGWIAGLKRENCRQGALRTAGDFTANCLI